MPKNLGLTTQDSSQTAGAPGRGMTVVHEFVKYRNQAKLEEQILFMLPPQDELQRLHADICAGLADPTRIAILYVLYERESNVTDLVERLGLPQSTVSRHLAILRATNLVYAKRQGQNTFYQLTDPRVINALDLLREVLRARVTRHAQAVSTFSQEE